MTKMTKAAVLSAPQTSFAVQDVELKVVLSYTSCGECGACEDGHPAYCSS